MDPAIYKVAESLIRTYGEKAPQVAREVAALPWLKDDSGALWRDIVLTVDDLQSRATSSEKRRTG